MRRYIVIPDDVPAINPDTDEPFVSTETGEVLKISFARYVRILTNRVYELTEDERSVTELRIKLTAPPGTVVGVEDDMEAYGILMRVVEAPKDAYKPENLVTCILTFAPFAKVLLNMSTERPAA